MWGHGVGVSSCLYYLLFIDSSSSRKSNVKKAAACSMFREELCRAKNGFWSRYTAAFYRLSIIFILENCGNRWNIGTFGTFPTNQ
jgi:hypothetical protein